jgi:oxalate decarboxylase
MTIFLAKGQVVAEQFAAGDVGYAPMGAGHYIKNTGAEVCRVLIGFDSRHLTYFSAISLFESMSVAGSTAGPPQFWA